MRRDELSPASSIVIARKGSIVIFALIYTRHLRIIKLPPLEFVRFSVKITLMLNRFGPTHASSIGKGFDEGK